MKFSVLIGVLLINLINGNYLLVEVDGMKNKPSKSSAKRCINGWMKSPSDCNGCSCVDDGVCTKVMGCTEKGCPTEQRNLGEVCDLILNNCVDGFTCQKVKDVCEDNYYGRIIMEKGRCVKIAVF